MIVQGDHTQAGNIIWTTSYTLGSQQPSPTGRNLDPDLQYCSFWARHSCLWALLLRALGHSTLTTMAYTEIEIVAIVHIQFTGL